MTKPMTELRERYGELADLSFAQALLAWDQEIYMPAAASAGRANQQATLAAITHERLLSPRFDELLAALAENDAALSGDDRAFVREFTFARERARKLPTELVKTFALEQVRAFEAWGRARARSDFSLFAPHLERLVELTRQKADCFGWRETPWDALVPDYERGMTARRLREVFAPLRAGLLGLLDRVRRAPQIDTRFLDRVWDLDRQREFAHRVAQDLGYDFEAGRLDRSPHPFTTTIGPGDVRITTRFDARNFFESLLSTIHETGHALYEQGFRADDARTPLANAPSLGAHESQSLFWEYMIGRSRPFWDHYFPVMKQYFPGHFDGVGALELYRAANRVEPGLIRTKADGVTYHFHIFIRFDIEVALLDGSLKAADVPDVWNARYKQDLGLDVPDEADGCLQDIHWSHGAFGYFPTYSLGHLYAAMLKERIESELPSLWGETRSGRFGATLEWLRATMHRLGARHEPADLMRIVTGRELTAEPLLRHLEGRCAEVYGLS